ncbi:hypothetical protein K488DRAFT_49166, partial [Vararia minispora EC-137]
GIAAQLPSGIHSPVDFDYGTFWDFLLKGGNAAMPLSSAQIPDSDPLSSRVTLPQRGSFLKKISEFDHIAFGISVRDARAMPFSHRRLVELSFEALLDSGINYRGQRVGCYMSGNDDTEHLDTFDTEGSLANVPSSMAGRISYALNLTGPSMVLDTACSSSLTAVHLAVAAIERGECTAAIVGACQSNRRLVEWENYVQSNVLSSDGTCKAFDADADGFGRGEGAVVVVLKLEAKALQDGDHIYGVIQGSAINSTGSGAPLYVPNGRAQQDCIQAAYKKANVDIADVDYLELHATGTRTRVGDPIEANAAGELFSRDGQDCIIGSVKSNVGHLECCAFLASLVKACLMFEHQLIPPASRLSTPNPTIKWDGYRLLVPGEARPLSCRSRSGRSTIAISSAGIGGFVGHVVLQAPLLSPSCRAAPLGAAALSLPRLFLTGGLSPVTFETTLKTILGSCEHDPNQVAVLLARRARQFPWRSYTLFPSPTSFKIPAPSLAPPEPPFMVFVFSGQGPHHLEMGRQLFSRYPVFRHTILELDAHYREICGQSMIETTGLFTDRDVQPTIELPTHGWPVAITCPALAMVHIALYDLLLSIGLRADAFVGHSAGETPLIYTSGAGPKEMALEIAIARGRAMTRTEVMDAGMAALACNSDRAEAILSRACEEQAGGEVSISCYNAPESVTISGSNVLLDRAVEIARAEKLFAQRVRTFVPGHSAYMDACEALHKSLMGNVFSRYPNLVAPTVPVYSTCSNTITVEEFSADYYWNNCRNPVKFSSAIFSILESRKNSTRNTVFVEVSPHAVLSSSILAHGVDPAHVLCPMHRSTPSKPVDESIHLFHALGKISVLGVNDIDLRPLYGSALLQTGRWLRYPLIPRSIPPHKTFVDTQGTMSHKGLEVTPIFKHPRSTFSDLTDHAVLGSSTFPMTGFIELTLELGAVCLWDTEFTSMLPLSTDGKADIRVERLGHRWYIYTVTESDRRVHAQGCMDSSDISPPPRLDIDPFLKVFDQKLKRLLLDFYDDVSPAMFFGPLFRRVTGCRGDSATALVSVKALASGERHVIPLPIYQTSHPAFSSEQYVLHPALLDACVHATLHTSILQNRDEGSLFLPSRFESFSLHRRPALGSDLFSIIKLKDWYPDRRVFDVQVVDTSGNAICGFIGLTLQRSATFSIRQPPVHYDLVYQPFSPTVRKPPTSPSTIYVYRRGEEESLRTSLQVLDSSQPRMIVLAAAVGADGDSAQALAQTLDQEFGAWRVRSVAFENFQGPFVVDAYMDLLETENSLLVNLDGQVMVPRLVPITSAPPSLTQNAFPPEIPAEHVSIALSSRSTIASVACLTGKIIACNSSKHRAGESVTGISPSLPQTGQNVATIHAGCIFRSKGHPSADVDTLGALICALALGPSRLHRPRVVRPILHVLVNIRGEDLTRATTSYLALSSSATATTIPSRPEELFDVVLTDSVTLSTASHLLRHVKLRGRLVIWDTDVLRLLEDDPWAVQHAIHSVHKLLHTTNYAATTENTLVDEAEASSGTTTPVKVSEDPTQTTRRLFGENQSYLLVGGLSALGLHIAMWMYENGARNVILTSRHGPDALAAWDTLTRKKLAYLNSLSGLRLLLQKCDATSVEETKTLLSELDQPLGGCLLLALSLSDALFLKQTERGFNIVRESKVKAFEVLSSNIDITSLDFLVHFSSISGLVGYIGQSNYASACAELDGMLSKYANAFSLVLPAILDVGIVSRLDARERQELERWGMSVEEICRSLGDGIAKVQAKGTAFGRYIPDLDWMAIADAIGTLPSHDRPTEGDVVYGRLTTTDEDGLLEVITQHLGIARADLAVEQPLVSFGLDSLGAARLAQNLRAFVAVTQVQLLGSTTAEDLLARHRAATSRAPDDEVVVRLVDGEGVPVITLHDVTGSVTTLLRLRPHFTTPLWVVQATRASPLHDLEELASFYYAEIKKRVPTGPYRLAAFSASSVLSVALVRAFEDAGDVVLSHTFIDHFPAFWARLADVPVPHGSTLGQAVRDAMVSSVIDMLQRDGPSGAAQADEIAAAYAGGDASVHTQELLRVFDGMTSSTLALMREKADGDFGQALPAVMKWMAGVRAPISVVIAADGIATTLPSEMRASWERLGVEHAQQAVTVHRVDAGHFDVLGKRETADAMKGIGV